MVVGAADPHLLQRWLFRCWTRFGTIASPFILIDGSLCNLSAMSWRRLIGQHDLMQIWYNGEAEFAKNEQLGTNLRKYRFTSRNIVTIPMTLACLTWCLSLRHVSVWLVRRFGEQEYNGFTEHNSRPVYCRPRDTNGIVVVKVRAVGYDEWTQCYVLWCRHWHIILSRTEPSHWPGRIYVWWKDTKFSRPVS